MVGFRKREREEEAEIPTASMADIAFLLIIFFMVTTVFAREKGLKLLLPERQAQTVKLSGEKMLVIS
ncbi:MAG: ExbD/TolR family protein, partial [Candidatus Hydrothermia bacterium]